MKRNNTVDGCESARRSANANNNTYVSTYHEEVKTMKKFSMLGWTAAAIGALSMGYAVAAAAAAAPLVTPKWVADHACKPGIVVLDLRSPVGGGGNYYSFLHGHVKCAVYSDYKKAGWRVKDHGVPGMLPPTAKLQKLIRSLGINNGDHVVLYTGGYNALDMGSAARVFWTFNVLGDDNVSIMNGGYAAYAKAKLPVQTGANKPNEGNFTAHFQPRYLVTEKEMVKAMHEHGVTLVDNRPSAQYLGVVKPGMDKRAGTIPGAKNMPQGWLTVNDGGEFRTAAQIKALYKYAGVPTSGKQINFCNTGHWASLGWFVSSQILGNKDAKVYDGSMSQWTRNPKLPVQQQVKVAD